MAKTLDEVSTGSFEYDLFRGSDYGVGAVFLVEPKGLRTVNIKGDSKEGLDVAIVSFVDKKPDEVAKVTFTAKGLVRPLRDHIGGAAALKLEQVPTSKGAAWVWAQPTAAEKKAVQAYLNKREEAADEPEDDDDFDPDAL